MRVQCEQIFIVVFFSHDIAFQGSFAEVLMFMNKHKQKDTNFIFRKVLLEFRYVYLNKPFGFHLPPREVVHRNI